MLGKNDCKSCHIIDRKSVGPSYQDVANKYKGDSKAVENLSKKVIAGGGGVWGEHMMAAHPQISQAEANIIVQYILNINEPITVKSLPTKGSYATKVPDGQKPNGSYILRAAYKDKGTKGMKSLATEDLIVLRNATLNPEMADKSKGTQLMITPSRAFSMIGNDSYLGYSNIDLNGISEIEISAQAQTRIGAAGGIFEVRLDSPTGKLIGQSDRIEPKGMRVVPTVATIPVAAATTSANAQPAQPVPAPDPAARRNMGSSKLKVVIPANSGQHDVYFVFKNDKAKETQVVMSLSGIEFKNTEVN